MDEYAKLLGIIHECSSKMQDKVFIDIDNLKDSKDKYVIILMMEAFKGVELCCHAFSIQAYCRLVHYCGKLLNKWQQVLWLKNIKNVYRFIQNYKNLE